MEPTSERARLVLSGAGLENGSSSSATFHRVNSLEMEMEAPVSPSALPSPMAAITDRRHPYHRIRLVAAAFMFALLLAMMAALLAATIARCRQEGGAGCLIAKRVMPAEWGGSGALWPTKKRISRIGFGSCSAYDIRNQSIWEQGVIPSEPDMWLWVGDAYYADDPPFSCGLENANSSMCQCEASFLKQPPYMCPAGELDNARDKMVAQVLQPGYQAFLRYSCPGFDASGTAVPPGDDLSVCHRPIVGVYDDHDYGVNNLNRRLPNKHLFKQIYLDALGVASTSPRRASQQGIQWQYKLNPGTRQEVDLLLLDERYERAPLPCEVRGDWCRNIVLKDSNNPRYVWCDDFLRTGGATGLNGSCCKADGQIADGWCKQEGSKADPLWDVGCNPSSPHFGMQPLVARDGRLQPRDVQRDAGDAEEDSTFCELLGPRQRAWLDGVLSASTAPVKLIASGSVVLGSTGLDANTPANEWTGHCSGDDWDCYRPAQLALFHTLQRHAAQHGGCYIVLTGDYHYSDIKVAQPGSSHVYSNAYQTANWSTPLYQVMASGMTNSTARPGAECSGYRKERSGLRVEGDCGFVSLAAFGMLDFDWDKRRLSMQIRGAEAPHGGSVLQQLTISLDTCRPVEGDG